MSSTICDHQQQQSLNRPTDGDAVCTLKEWFLMSGSGCMTNKNDTESTTTTTTKVVPPRILLLDGGVSTHLEEKIRQCRCCNATTTTATNNDDNDDNNIKEEVGDVFRYRELWSSSLLLTEQGRQQIYEGHADWLQQAQVDILTTVTYQCHYRSALWPQRTPPSPRTSPTDQEDEISKEEESTEPSTKSISIITNEIMDQMWHDGIQLAQQAVAKMGATLTASTSSVATVPPEQRSQRRSSRDHHKYVVASSGCYGAALSNGAEYTGIYSENHDDPQLLSQIIYDFHLQKLQAILRNDNPPVDGIAIETVPSYLECQVLRHLFRSNDIVHEKMNSVACYVSLSCRNGSQLNDGTTLIDALKVFHNVTAIQAIGLNCCSIRYIPDLLRILLTDMVQYTPNRGIVIFPNSGELWDGITKQWYPDPELVVVSSATTTSTKAGITTTTTTDAVTLMTRVIHHIDAIWKELCVGMDDVDTTSSLPLRNRRKPSIVIGGCCRMTVETIAALRRLVDEYLHNEPN
jgi:S-methylmethionine-dependent homocysteine/selenocysteine methylase